MSSYQSIFSHYFFEIILSAISYTSPMVHKAFLVPSLCYDIATLLPIEFFFLSFVYSSSANTNLTSHKETWMYYAIHEFFAWIYFSVKEPNNNPLMNPTFLSNAHTLWSLIFKLSMQMLKNQGIFPLSMECQWLHIKHMLHNRGHTPI
jgi:hypothetical protein